MSLTTPPDTGFLTFGPSSADAEERVAGIGNLPHCPVGEGVVGIHGRFGLFVDALGLICGPLPPGPGAPATKVDPRLVMPAPDIVVITKPLAGDKIPHGQLFISGAPPKVRSTDMVELELRYLDAPANLQHSYPYTTIFSVTMVQLLDGYPVTERVTGGYVGRWQVRARSSMKMPPGPWSFPVQFEMVKAPPPPPMLQMPKPNAPITQTPAPSSSAPAQMRRSPSMIMPRGVDEKEAGSETVEPKEPAKKP